MRRIQDSAHKHALWKRGDRFIIGVSGGPDSLCLLHVLSELSKRYEFSLHIVHVNYGLRGRDSLRDEALVRKEADRYGIKLSVFHPKIASKSNLEERLRDIRYRAFERVRVREKADLIAVAHNEDDQAETFLLRLLRGAGRTGLSGMQPKNGRIIRPLLKVPRKAILRYLEEEGLPFRTDASNSDGRFLRNRIQNTLLPILEQEFQPNIKHLLAETAETLSHEENPCQTALRSLELTTRSAAFSRKEALSLPKGKLSLLLRSLIHDHLGKEYPRKSLLEELLKTLKSRKSKPQMVIFRGLKLEAKGDKVRLLCSDPNHPDKAF